MTTAGFLRTAFKLLYDLKRNIYMNLYKSLSAAEKRAFGTDIQKNSYINNWWGTEVGGGSWYSSWLNGQDSWWEQLMEKWHKKVTSNEMKLTCSLRWCDHNLVSSMTENTYFHIIQFKTSSVVTVSDEEREKNVKELLPHLLLP